MSSLIGPMNAALHSGQSRRGASYRGELISAVDPHFPDGERRLELRWECICQCDRVGTARNLIDTVGGMLVNWVLRRENPHLIAPENHRRERGRVVH
jgi:hypothetical protein